MLIIHRHIQYILYNDVWLWRPGFLGTGRTPYRVEPVLLWRVLLLLDAEEVEDHGGGEQDGGKDEEDLFLGLEDRSEEGVRPVQTSQGIAHSAAQTCRQDNTSRLAKSGTVVRILVSMETSGSSETDPNPQKPRGC